MIWWFFENFRCVNPGFVGVRRSSVRGSTRGSVRNSGQGSGSGATSSGVVSDIFLTPVDEDDIDDLYDSESQSEVESVGMFSFSLFF